MGYRSASPHQGPSPTHLTYICFSPTVNSPRFLGKKTYSELNLVIYHLLPLHTHESSPSSLGLTLPGLTLKEP